MTERSLSIVVQGAVSRRGTASTDRVLRALRVQFPDAELVLSTWRGADVVGLEPDELVLSVDPRMLPERQNTNRQIVSTRAGLERSSGEVVLKTRTDILHYRGDLTRHLDRFPARTDELRVFGERLLVPHVFTRRPSLLAPYPFHASDWCVLGTRADVALLFDAPLLDPASMLMEHPQTPLARLYCHDSRPARLTPEQHLWASVLRRVVPDLPFAHRWDLTPETHRLTELFLANNVVVLDTYDDFGAWCPKYPHAGRAFADGTLVDHAHWQDLYRTYCLDPEGRPAAEIHEADDRWDEELRRAAREGRRFRRDVSFGGPRPDIDGPVVAMAEAELAARRRPRAGRAAAAASVEPVVVSPTRITEPVVVAGAVVDAYPVGRHAGLAARPAAVSVCVPVRNGGTRLDRCLESIMGGFAADLHVLVVDNDSDDGSFEAACAHADRDPRVVAYRNRGDIGRVPNWNRCLDLATGRYVKFVMANDFLLPSCLDELVAAMDAAPSAVLGRSAVSYLDDDGRVIVGRLRCDSALIPGPEALDATLTGGNIAEGPTAQIMRRAPLEAHGLRFDEGLSWAADFELCTRLLRHGDLVYRDVELFLFDLSAAARFHHSPDRVLQLREECEIALRTLRAPGPGFTPTVVRALETRIVRRAAELAAGVTDPVVREELERIEAATLRALDPPEETLEQPGVGDLPALAAALETAGLDVRIRLTDAGPALVLVDDAGPTVVAGRVSGDAGGGARAILRGDLATGSLDPQAAAALHRARALWVPSGHARGVALAAGLDDRRIRVVPPVVDLQRWTPEGTALPFDGRRACSFLAPLPLTAAGGWDVLLAAYVEEFAPGEDVALVLQPTLSAAADLDQVAAALLDRLAALGRDPESIPDIVLRDGREDAASLPALHRASSAVVLPGRTAALGLAWSRAAATGRPVVGTRWALEDVLTDETGYPLPHRLVPAPEPHAGRWAEPDLGALRRALRAVAADADAADRRGRAAREIVVARTAGVATTVSPTLDDAARRAA